MTTSGAPRTRQYARAGVASANVSKRAVGTPCLAIKPLAKAFEPSIIAAARDGPKIRRPRDSNRSTIPATSGASGPTTVRSMRWPSANRASSSIASAGIGRHVA